MSSILSPQDVGCEHDTSIRDYVFVSTVVTYSEKDSLVMYTQIFESLAFCLQRSNKSACQQNYLEKLNSLLKDKSRSNTFGAKCSDSIENATEICTTTSIWLC